MFSLVEGDVMVSKELVRVLCVFARLDLGGAETMCMNLYRNIDRSRVQFDFVKHTHDKCEYEDEIISLGGKIYEAPAYSIYNHFSYCRWWKQHLLNHPEYKIVHGHYFTISAVYLKVARKMGCVTICHSHNTEPKYHSWKDIIKGIYIKRAEMYSDYALACAKKAGEWLFPNKVFTVLNNAISIERFQYNESIRLKIRKEFGIEKNFVLGTVGRITFQKNPFGILEIVERVCKNNPNVKLLWAGEGDLEVEIKNKIREKTLFDYIIMAGVRQNVNELLQAMDVFFLPSFFEGLPLVCIEAQAAGLPCFISDKVSLETDITGLCRFISLDDYEIWAEEILKTDITCRRNTEKEIINAGYDIHRTAQWLEEFYLDKI